MSNERNSVNREYKDRLFKLVFREKEDLLKLHNAVSGTDYDNPEDLVTNTLEDAFRKGGRSLQQQADSTALSEVCNFLQRDEGAAGALYAASARRFSERNSGGRESGGCGT